MTSKVQKVMIIDNASSKDQLFTQAIGWSFDGLPLQPGDKILLLGVIQLFRTAPTSFFSCISKSSRSRLHSSATIKKRQEKIIEEIAKKKHEYNNSVAIRELKKLAEMKQIEFETKVEVDQSLKDAIVQSAIKLEATSVILERQMKKELKYYVDNLSCAILRMRRDGSAEHVRGPKSAQSGKMPLEISQSNMAALESSNGTQKQQVFEKSICSICNNKRPNIGPPKEFTLSELESATNEFQFPNSNSLSKNKEIYRGELKDGQKIAVKKLGFAGIRETDEIKFKVHTLGKVRHENIAMLLGSCSQGSHRFLVYEYVCNGSLDQHLSNKSKELTWERRMKIAMGAARGLQYLHRNNIYGSMRPENILITHDYEPLLTNFGLSKNQYEEGSNHSSENKVLRTFEYLAPEYEESGIDSSEADVYSFGVVLLELITGRKNLDETNGQSFLRWARPLIEMKNYGHLIDPAVEDSHDIHQLYCMVCVTEKCLSWDPKIRFSIDKAVRALTYVTQGKKVGFSPPKSELREQSTRTSMCSFSI